MQNQPIAEVRNYSNSEECVANAAFICKSVNGYEGLLNALKVCQFQLQTWAENDAWSVADESAYELAAEAIKKSELT